MHESVQKCSIACVHHRRPRATVVSTRDKRGNTLLSVAAWKNQLQVAELLLTHHLSLGDEFGAKAITGTDENKAGCCLDLLVL